MFLRNVDLISPRITLYYNKNLRHINHISGAISLLIYSSILGISIYFLYLLLNRKEPTAYFFKKFEHDIGKFSLNASSIFHFYTVGKTNIDYNSINIIGITEYISRYKNDNNISNMEHWLYGQCDETDIEGINKNIINQNDFLRAACIKYKWNIEEQKYYSKQDGKDKFYYPALNHGASNQNNFYYGTIIEKCRNTTMNKLGFSCKDSKSISEYVLNATGLAVTLIDNYVDVSNYSNPIVTFLYTITNGMVESTFTSNQLNFNPLEVKTHNGFMFENTERIRSFMFEQNAKQNIETEESGILCAFYYWMQNRVQVYERSYKKIQDTCASIGGMTKIILIAGEALNFILSQFTIYIDSSTIFNKILRQETLNNNSNTEIKTNKNWLKPLQLHLEESLQPFPEITRDHHIKINNNTGIKTLLNNPILHSKTRGEINLDMRKTSPKEELVNNNKEIICNHINNPLYKKVKTFDTRINICYFIMISICPRMNKHQKASKGIAYILNFRKLVLSEEFLFSLYISSKYFKSQTTTSNINSSNIVKTHLGLKIKKQEDEGNNTHFGNVKSKISGIL